MEGLSVVLLLLFSSFTFRSGDMDIQLSACFFHRKISFFYKSKTEEAPDAAAPVLNAVALASLLAGKPSTKCVSSRNRAHNFSFTPAPRFLFLIDFY